MPALYFNGIAADSASTFPNNPNVSLNNNGVNVTSLGTSVKAVLFTIEPTLNAATANINLNAGGETTTVTIDTAYSGKTVAVLLNDETSYIFTLNTGTTNQTGAANGYDSVSSEKVRRWNIGGLGGAGLGDSLFTTPTPTPSVTVTPTMTVTPTETPTPTVTPSA